MAVSRRAFLRGSLASAAAAAVSGVAAPIVAELLRPSGKVLYFHGPIVDGEGAEVSIELLERVWRECMKGGNKPDLIYVTDEVADTVEELVGLQPEQQALIAGLDAVEPLDPALPLPPIRKTTAPWWATHGQSRRKGGRYGIRT